MCTKIRLYLADGYDIVRSYTDGLEIKEEKKSASVDFNPLCTSDTCKLGLTEAQAYAVVWKTFQEIQQAAPRAVVFYGQETGVKRKSEKPFDELGVLLLPIHEFEKMLQHMEVAGSSPAESG